MSIHPYISTGHTTMESAYHSACIKLNDSPKNKKAIIILVKNCYRVAIVDLDGSDDVFYPPIQKHVYYTEAHNYAEQYNRTSQSHHETLLQKQPGLWFFKK